jgi:hypothetical protein
MLTEASDKLFVRETHLHLLRSFPIIFVAESNLAVIQVDEPMITNGYLVGVAAQILHHRFRMLERPFGIYHPWFIKQAVKEGPFLLREFSSQASHEPGPKDLAHGLYWKEELAFIPGRLPFTSFGYSSTRNDARSGTECRCGCKLKFCPQVCSTAIIAGLAPRCLVSLAKLCITDQAVLKSKAYTLAGAYRQRRLTCSGRVNTTWK